MNTCVLFHILFQKVSIGRFALKSKSYLNQITPLSLGMGLGLLGQNITFFVFLCIRWHQAAAVARK